MIEHRSEAWPFIPVWRLEMSRPVHPKPFVPLSRGGVESDPESRRGVARQKPARGPVGRSLMLAGKGAEMRSRGDPLVTLKKQGPSRFQLGPCL